MLMTLKNILALVMITLSLSVHSEPIRYLFSGYADFELGGQFLSNRYFEIDLIGDTNLAGTWDYGEPYAGNRTSFLSFLGHTTTFRFDDLSGEALSEYDITNNVGLLTSHQDRIFLTNSSIPYVNDFLVFHGSGSTPLFSDYDLVSNYSVNSITDDLDGFSGGVIYETSVGELKVHSYKSELSFNATLLNNPPIALPVPAAAWLFGSALIGLAGIKRKK